MFVKGELVRIKEEFWLYAPAHRLGINDYMHKMQGQEYEVRLTHVYGIKTHYRLYTDTEHDWVWDENWLEPANVIKDVYTEELDLLFKGD